MPVSTEPPEGAWRTPHTARNTGPILDVLGPALSEARARTVLEIACGGGEQSALFAAALPRITWQPTDIDGAARASAGAWQAASALPNLLPPIPLDAADTPWDLRDLPAGFTPEAMVAINMIHIAPFAACEGLLREAGRRLPPGGIVYLYGPYRMDGRHTAPSNAAFDESLRTRNPDWGIRDLEEVAALADTHGLTLDRTVGMPANNLSVLFRRG